MPTLYVLSGPEIGRAIEFAGTVRLGRSSKCEVCLREGSVSREHARIEREGGKWCVLDLESRNGLFKDKARVRRIELEDGDLFRLGKLELRFRSEVEAPPPPVDAAPPRSAQPVEPRSEPQIEVDELRLEGFDDREPEPEPEPERATTPPPPPPAPAAAAPPVAPAARRPAPPPTSASVSPTRPASKPAVQDSRGVLRYSRHAQSSGFSGAELSQYPAWVRFGVVLLALLVFAVVFFLAFKGTGVLKGAPDEGEVYYEETGE